MPNPFRVVKNLSIIFRPEMIVWTNGLVYLKPAYSVGSFVFKAWVFISTGILVQLPLPKHINEERVLTEISLEKDVDGFHPLNIGKLAMKGREPLFLPCTPQANPFDSEKFYNGLDYIKKCVDLNQLCKNFCWSFVRLLQL